MTRIQYNEFISRILFWEKNTKACHTAPSTNYLSLYFPLFLPIMNQILSFAFEVHKPPSATNNYTKWIVSFCTTNARLVNGPGFCVFQFCPWGGKLTMLPTCSLPLKIHLLPPLLAELYSHFPINTLKPR